MESTSSSHLGDMASQIVPVETKVTHEIASASLIEVPLVILCVILLLFALRRSQAAPVVFLILGFVVLATRAVVGMAQVYWQPNGFWIYHCSSYLGVLAWIMISWYCFRLANPKSDAGPFPPT